MPPGYLRKNGRIRVKFVQYIIVWKGDYFKEIIFWGGKKGSILREYKIIRKKVEFRGQTSNVLTKKTIQNLQNVNFCLTNPCHS